MVERILFAPGGASEAKQDDILAALTAALVELQGKFEAGQEVALDAATLAALESIQAQVAGTVALDAPTLAALENVTATVANFPADYPDAGALAALAAILAALGGTLTVNDGHPDPQTDALTDAELRAADLNVADSGEREYTHVTATVTASGDTTVYTPSAGMAVRVHWIYAINDPVASTAPLIKVSLGAVEKFRVYALAKRQLMTGAADAPLVINLSTTGSVAVTAVLEEVDP